MDGQAFSSLSDWKIRKKTGFKLPSVTFAPFFFSYVIFSVFFFFQVEVYACVYTTTKRKKKKDLVNPYFFFFHALLVVENSSSFSSFSTSRFATLKLFLIACKNSLLLVGEVWPWPSLHTSFDGGSPNSQKRKYLEQANKTGAACY